MQLAIRDKNLHYKHNILMADTTTTQTPQLQGSQTEKNLLNSYLAESQAYARYVFSAQQAEKENYYPIQQVFLATADNELHHAKIFMKYLTTGRVMTADPSVNAGVIGDTATMLKIAIYEEDVEGEKLYKSFAQTAREEGFADIAAHFEAIASVEHHHHERFVKLLQQVESGTVWKRDTPITWQCLVCGFEFVGTEPPMKCPGCDHPREHYMPLDMRI